MSDKLSIDLYSIKFTQAGPVICMAYSSNTESEIKQNPTAISGAKKEDVYFTWEEAKDIIIKWYEKKLEYFKGCDPMSYFHIIDSNEQKKFKRHLETHV